MSTKRGRLALGLLLVTVSGIAYAMVRENGAQAASPPGPAAAPAPPTIPVAEVVVRSLAPTVDLTGTLAAVERVDLRPRVSGVVEEVRVPEGGLVRRGQLLFRLDPRPFRVALDQARAALDDATQRHALARDELRRARELRADAVIADRELDVRTSTAGQAASSVDAARALVRARALELGYTRVTSPIDGRVSEAFVKAGNLVSGGSDTATLLATVVSQGTLYVEFGVDEPTYLSLRARERTADGRLAPTRVQVGLAGQSGHPYEATLDYLAPSLDVQSGTARARAVLDDDGGRLGPGLFVRVRLATNAPRDVVLVADATVHTDALGRFVLLVSETNAVEARYVDLGPVVDGLRSVTRGLAPGDRIVVGGMVGPGLTIRPRRVPMPTPSATSRSNGGVR